MLAELHLLLNSNVAFFTNVPIISFENTRSLKGHIFRDVLTKVYGENRSKPYGGEINYCEVCKSGKYNFHFKMRDTSATLNILKGALHCNFNDAICLPECK